MRTAIRIAAFTLCIALPVIAQQKDVSGCKDHPLFNRMPDSWIHNCTQKEFDSYAFVVAKGKTSPVEGKLWYLSYYPQASAAVKPSELQILRNFENAVTRLGGKVLYSEKSRETMQLVKDGRELWIEVTAEFTGKYGLRIVERAAMQQNIVANAAVFAGDLASSGHTTVPGITFETDKAVLTPESAQAVGEIAALLKKDPGLAVYIVGHTDNTGNLESNMTLSRARADAVVQELVTKHGIGAARLASFGAGPYAPVASNDTEQGRAQNRRVELVKR